MIAQIVNFGLVFAALWLIAAKPLKKLIHDRSCEITTGLENAKSSAELLEKTKAEYDAALQKARIEASQIFERGKKDAEEEKAAMIEKARADVAAMVESGRKNLEAEKQKMVNEAKADIVSLVVRATEKVAGAAVTEGEIRKELGSM